MYFSLFASDKTVLEKLVAETPFILISFEYSIGCGFLNYKEKFLNLSNSNNILQAIIGD